MATLYTEQSKNIWKTWGLMTVFIVIIIVLGWWISWYYGNPIILYGFVLFGIFMNITSYWYSDKIVIASTHAKPVTKDQYWDYVTVVENLAITAGLPTPKIYVVDDPAPNAFATGRDKNHAAVVATTGLLAIMNRTELEGVIGHELSHIGNRDILVSTVVVVLVGLIVMLSDLALRMSFFGGGRDREGGGQAQLVIMIVGVVLVILSPIFAQLIQLAVSRKREYLADASGALLTRYPEGLASALEKIEQHSQKMITANNATAHLFISNPFGLTNGGKKKGQWLANLFMTHPPIEDRIRILRNMPSSTYSGQQ